MRSIKIKSLAIILLLALSFSMFIPLMVSAEDADTSLKITDGVTVIEATDFDAGKYYESNAADGSHNVRTDEEVQTEFCGDSYVGREDVNGSEIGNIGWTAADEWVQYTVNVEKSGIYEIDAWVASGSGEPGAVEISIDGTVIGAAQSSNDGWQNYSKVSVGTAEITEGTYVIKALFPTGGINFQALEFNRIGRIPVVYKELTEEPDKEHKIVTLGDSIPAHYGISEDQGYVSLLSGLLDSKNINNKMINLAKSGSTTADILELLETEKAITALEGADAVTISIGGNNILAPLMSYLWALTAMVNQKYYVETESPAIGNFYFTTDPTSNFQYDLGNSYYASISMEALEKAFDLGMNEETMAVIELAIEAFAADLNSIIERIEELAPEALVYISTVYNPVDTKLNIGKKINPILDALNAIIIAGAQDGSYRVVDVASTFEASERNLTGFDLVRRMYDVHPNRFGHVEIAKLYCDAMTGNYVQPVLEIPTETPVTTSEILALKALAEAIKAGDIEAIAEALEYVDFQVLLNGMKAIDLEALLKAVEAEDVEALIEALKAIDFEALIGA